MGEKEKEERGKGGGKAGERPLDGRKKRREKSGDKYRKRGRRRTRVGKRKVPTARRAVKGPLEEEEEETPPLSSVDGILRQWKEEREGERWHERGGWIGGWWVHCMPPPSEKEEGAFSWTPSPPPPPSAHPHPPTAVCVCVCAWCWRERRRGRFLFFAGGGDDLVWRKGGGEDGIGSLVLSQGSVDQGVRYK